MVSDNSFDTAYLTNGLLFGDKPTIMLDDFLNKNPSIGCALDLGCGEGRDTIHLLKRGYEVTAVDKSPVGINKLLSRPELSIEMKSSLITTICNVLEFDWQKKYYDLIVAVTLLDHLDAEQIPKICNSIIKSAKDQAIIFIEVHTDRDPALTGKGPVSEFSSAIKHYFKANELLYCFLPSIQILEYEDRLEWDYDHGEPHQHGFATLIGKKES